MTIGRELAALFRRDLSTLGRHVEAFPDDAMLWRSLPGSGNPAGNLVLHIEGNLREYVGRQLGGIPYQRARDLEFNASGYGRADLGARVDALAAVIPGVIAELSAERLAAPYPEAVFGASLSTLAFLIHLQGHLNWHLGQIDYLRRALSGQGAVPRAPLGSI